MAGTSEAAVISVDGAVEQIRKELERLHDGTTTRLDCNSENVEQALAKLVLTLVEFLRRLLERQAIRRMEGGTLGDEKVEEMGMALMKLEQKVAEIANAFGLQPEDLNLELGPLGNLLPKE
ncbi:MAG: gas vesicle protein K [Acidobacteriales bacterium]|nr:gas vesicle protein K [Terriglobales bacterium]